MFTNLVFIHILHKIYKKESQKTHNCIPYRLELTNWTPVKNKEQAEIHQNQLKNLSRELVGCLEDHWNSKELNPRGVRERMRSIMTT